MIQAILQSVVGVFSKESAANCTEHFRINNPAAVTMFQAMRGQYQSMPDHIRLARQRETDIKATIARDIKEGRVCW